MNMMSFQQSKHLASWTPVTRMSCSETGVLLLYVVLQIKNVKGQIYNCPYNVYN